MTADDLRPLRRALLSVSDKTGLVPFAADLAERGVELVSTGGTARALAEAGLVVRDVSDLTGFPEMMDGRVKTLHPAVHGGLLALRDDPSHAAAMAAHGIAPIDLLVVNLYPFEATVAAGGDFAACVENIDIGGPAMLRAAAKNHGYVSVLTEPADYEALLAELAANDGQVGGDFRRRMAAKVFAHTASYDAAIAGWLAEALDDPFQAWATLAGKRAASLRYGENPHQRAALYLTGEARPGAATAELVQGKALSYNNLSDADAAFELAAEFAPGDSPACAIIKHANPCGVAVGATPSEAYGRAYDCDQVSAFGGVVAFNCALDEAAARRVTAIFTEVVIAPDADAAARRIFAEKPNLRLLLTGAMPDPRASGRLWRPIAGGMLVQDRDGGGLEAAEFRVVTKRAPTETEASDLRFAWRVAKHVKSNAIVYAKGGATVGVGAGQMSRVDSARIAARKAEDMRSALGLAETPTRGSVVASDAFFPFPDGLLTAAEAGATAVIQPGGSVRDEAVIAAADEAGLAMVFTGMRHFRHG